MSPVRFRPRRESAVLFGTSSATGVSHAYLLTLPRRNPIVDSDLYRRGCTQTAFEFAKLLYSLDPWTDPHGSLLHLDGLAVKAGMHDWLLDVWEFFETNPDGLAGRLTPTVLPGWWYTRALAMKVHEDSRGLEASGIAYLVCHPLTSPEF